MTFTTSIRTCLRKYATFSGRASRSEYWWFALFCFLGNLVATALEGMINAATGDTGGPTLISSVFALATFVPQLSAGWRRMHDTGRSGLYLFYPLIVMLGIASFAAFTGAFGGPDTTGALDGVATLILLIAGLVLLISPLLVLWWLTRPSQPGPNDYGPHPLEMA